MISPSFSRLAWAALFLAALLAKPQAGFAQPYPPEEALNRMTVPEGFRVRCVAHEPDVRKPVTISFDDRGRMWVIQYLQYPAPAGLKPVKVDQYLRTVYDRIPEPPPKGPKGADRITIYDDPDENGHYRKVKDFHVGLNLATGMCLGYGGVFVVQPPYLLYYKIKPGEDVPDGDPEVLLTGFGMEDSHAFANSLQWGPDGWLYGAQGSTVTAKIRGIEFQQGIWRYHPLTKEFELFAEGGGNTWGLDFDRHGNIIAGTNFGGQACLHQVQGGYYVKGFSKHGPLHNPYTFGYFDHIPYANFKGGHVTCGGIIYNGGAFPAEYNDHYIAANVLSSAIHVHHLTPKGSSFTAKLHNELLTSTDGAFRPVDCLVGPDGALYIADWCDKRANHVDPVDNWDKTRGRIWKLEYVKSNAAHRSPDLSAKPLSKYTSKELVGLLSHPNDWYAREARRILAERRDASVLPLLKQMLQQNKDQLAVEALWALYVSGGFNDELAATSLTHPNTDVRTWTVRLLGDAKKVSPTIRERLVAVAHADPSATVRNQLACSAKRLPVEDSFPIVRELLHRSEDADDPQIPLLLWWAVENKAEHRQEVLRLLVAESDWHAPLIQKHVIERLARRYMAEGNDVDFGTLATLLDRAPTAEEVDRILAGMDKGLEGRKLIRVPPDLEHHIDDLWKAKAGNVTLIRLALRLGYPPANRQALALIGDGKTPQADRTSLIETLSQLNQSDAIPVFIQLMREAGDAKVRQAALAALQPFADKRVTDAVLESYPRLPADLRNRAMALLCSRPASALEFLKLVEAKAVQPKDVPLDQLQRVVQFNNEAINKLVEKHWGKVGAQSSGEKQSRIRSLAGILRQGKGDALKGKEVFTKQCAICHTLFNEGNKIGPELTGADRKNLEFLLTSIVDPSAFIRPEYVAYNVVTKDGRVLTGLVVEESPKAVTLIDAKNEKTVVSRDSIEELAASPTSLMPEKILDPLDNQDIRDLFAYLQSDGPQNPAPRSSPAKAEAEKPLKVLLISGSLEYESDATLAAFQDYLEKTYNIKCSRAFRKADDDLPGLEGLDTCDVALFFTRRLQIDGDQLERIKKYCKAGKPIVAVRTASHGFQKWLAMDKEIFGGNYGNHYKEGPPNEVKIIDKVKDHPILAGVKEWKSAGSLYKNPDIAKDCEVLMTGSIPEHTEPIAWVRTQNGGRVFYTSLGHQKDFQEESFRQMLANALIWTAQRTPVKVGK